MSTATELLEQALELFDWMEVESEVVEDIRSHLDTEPEMQVYAHYDTDGNRTSDPDKIQSTLLVRK